MRWRPGIFALTGIALASIVLTVVTATLVVLGGNSMGIQCASYPSCLVNPATLVAFLHSALAGVLLLLAVANVVLAVALRRWDPRLGGAAILALLLLVMVAAFGALFARGTIPPVWAPVQFGGLGAFVLVLAWEVRRVRRGPGSPPPRNPPPLPAAQARSEA